MLIDDFKLNITEIAEAIYNDINNTSIKTEIAKNRKFKLNIVENSEINGCAWCENINDVIEINDGVIKIFQKYFKEVGEYYKNNNLQSLLSNVDIEEIEKMSAEIFCFSKDDYQIIDTKELIIKISTLLALLVTIFILYHEMGHLFNGHCLYLKQNKINSMKMYYSDDLSTESISALDIRTLEMDADAFASIRAIRYISRLYENPKYEIYNNFFKKEMIFLLWGFAIRSHFLTCEDNFMDTNRYNKEMKHLPSSARFAQVVDIATETIKDTFKDKKSCDRFCVLIVKGAVKAEEVFNIIKMSEYNKFLDVYTNEDYIKFINEIYSHWKKMADKVEVYSRCPVNKDNN